MATRTFTHHSGAEYRYARGGIWLDGMKFIGRPQLTRFQIKRPLALGAHPAVDHQICVTDHCVDGRGYTRETGRFWIDADVIAHFIFGTQS